MGFPGLIVQLGNWSPFLCQDAADDMSFIEFEPSTPFPEKEKSIVALYSYKPDARNAKSFLLLLADILRFAAYNLDIGEKDMSLVVLPAYLVEQPKAIPFIKGARECLWADCDTGRESIMEREWITHDEEKHELCYSGPLKEEFVCFAARQRLYSSINTLRTHCSLALGNISKAATGFSYGIYADAKLASGGRVEEPCGEDEHMFNHTNGYWCWHIPKLDNLLSYDVFAKVYRQAEQNIQLAYLWMGISDKVQERIEEDPSFKESVQKAWRHPGHPNDHNAERIASAIGASSYIDAFYQGIPVKDILA